MLLGQMLTRSMHFSDKSWGKSVPKLKGGVWCKSIPKLKGGVLCKSVPKLKGRVLCKSVPKLKGGVWCKSIPKLKGGGISRQASPLGEPLVLPIIGINSGLSPHI